MILKNKIFQLSIAVLSAFSVFAQPANDNCSGATSLGTLPTPGACIAGLQNGTATTLNAQTTVGATAENPYVYQTGCTGGAMTTFALSTWYSFVASGTIANVNITGFPNANVALWSGTCGNLLGRGCTIIGAGGNGTLVVTQIVPGQTYYIQVTGNSTTATDNNFSIAVDNDTDCNDCLLTATLTATPAPVNGGYTPGQVVQFCYTINGWSQQNTNWLHGVQVTMSPGWTGSMTGLSTAASAQGAGGSWQYYAGGIGVVNGVNWGPGFYYETTDIGTLASDNYGDNCNGAACTWTFCWNQTVTAACTPGASLAVTVNTSGDGESGSWGSSACTDDNASNFSAVQICCTAPTMSAAAVTCLGGNNGSVTATHGTGASPWDYVWTNSSGTNVGTTMNSAAASNTVIGLVAGTYTVTITDNVGCVTSNTVVVGPGVSCVCLMNLFTTNIGFCQPNNTFPVNGTFSYTNAPATGTIVVIVTNSSGTYTQTFNPPFVNGTVYNYNITNCISDGSASTVQVYFTATPSCQQLLNFTSPISCLCNADIGTFTADIIGVSNNNYVLCYGDVIDIQTNNDYTVPGIATNPPGPTYDPGVSWLIYSCPPTIGLVPSATEDVANDPCLLGIVSDYDLNDLNDQGMLNAFPAGTFTNNTIYYVPITMYSIVTGTYTYVNTTIPCYDLGTPYAVQYLPQIISTFVQNCSTVTATISGGLPAINGSQFTAVAGSLTPANASFGNTTCSNGGTIAINGLTAGQVFSFQVQDANGCPRTVTGTFTGPPTLTYPSASYCTNGANPSPTVVGVAGGTYTSTAGLVFVSAATGVINLTTSTAGTYTVTYTTPAVPGPVCTATFVITINPLPIIAVPDQTVCAGTAVTLSGNGANTYTWTGGVTNGVAFTPAATTTYTVTGTITATGCTSTDLATITVNPLPIVGAGIDQTVCAGIAVTLSGSGASTYTWDNGVTNGVAFTPAATTTYTVTGTSAAGCINTDQVIVTVNPIPVVSAGPDASICTGGSTTLTATGATTYSWAPGGQLTAAITVSPVATATYTVIGTSLGCTASDAVTVTILANAPINAGLDVAICIGASTTLTATGGVTYNWNNGLGIGNNFVVFPTVTTIYTVVGTNAGGCTGTDAITVTVNPLPIVGAGLDQTVCAGTAVTLSASGAATYTWNNGVTNGVSFTPAATTTYTVTGTTLGCTATDQVIVTVNPLPIVGAGVDQTVCAGTAVTLTGSGATTYTWTGGITNGVAFTPAATANYTVTGTTLGCTNTDIVTVTVNPLPIVNAGVDQTVCSGTAVTLSGAGASTYTWNNGVTNGVAFTPAVGAITYTVTGTSAAGCIATDQVVVTVNPNPVPLINGPSTYCTGNFALLSTSTPFTTYAWSTGSATPTINATIANNPISVVVTNAFGCSGTSPIFPIAENNIIMANFNVTICQGQSSVIHGIAQTVAGVYSQTFTLGTGCDSTSIVTLVVNPLPIVNAGVDQAVCTGVATTLTATSAATYTWNNGITNGVPFTQAIGPITYTVTGTSAAGCVNTDQVVVTVNPLPIVAAGIDQAVCAGTAVTLSASGASTYTWNNGVTNAVVFTPIATNTYTVTGTDVNGCVNTDQVLVTVNPIPTVGAGPDQAICIGASVTLSGSGAATYTWDNGVTNGTLFAPIATTSYTVTGTTAAGCSSTDEVIVTVNPLPVVNAGLDQTICIGASVTLNGAGASTYTWTNGVTNGVAFTPAVGTLTYTLTGTTAAGCISTDQVDVVVNPLPVVGGGPDQMVCAGTAVTLSGSGASTYTWNNGITDGIAFTPLATATYTVTGTSTAGCVNTDQVIVTVNPIPVVFAGNDVTICANQTVTLTGSGAATYAWDNGITNGIAFTPPAGTTTYTVTGTTAAGCINIDQINVTVDPIPIVSFTPNVTFGCVPLTVNFTNTTANSASGVWTMSDGTVLTGNGTVTNTFTQAGCFDITLTSTSTNGCIGTFTAIDLICTEAAPIASFIPSASIISELNPLVNFNNTTSGAVDYDWNFGDNTPNSILVNPSHDYSNTTIGNYIVTLIAYSPFGCVDTAYSTIQIYEELIFYVPNTFTPDNDDYNPSFQPIFTAGYDPYDYTLLIFNRWGEIVFESHNTEVGWDGSYGSNREVDLVQDGTYTWKIEFKTNRNDERVMRVGHVNIIR